MKPPETLEQFNTRYLNNNTFEDYGIETKGHYPCPGCAAPDWKVCKVMDFAEAIAEPATCLSCGRRFQGIVTRTPGSIRMEIVQSGGPDVPDWMQPKPRRIDPTPEGEG